MAGSDRDDPSECSLSDDLTSSPLFFRTSGCKGANRSSYAGILYKESGLTGSSSDRTPRNDDGDAVDPVSVEAAVPVAPDDK